MRQLHFIRGAFGHTSKRLRAADSRTCSVRNRRGIAVLLVILVLTAILSISLGVFNAVIGQLLISGEISNSFRALYAADEGSEALIYLDRVSAAPGGLAVGNSTTPPPSSLSSLSSACVEYIISKSGGIITLEAYGQDTPCAGGATPTVKRGFQVTY